MGTPSSRANRPAFASEQNLHQVLWVPLLVKTPGEAEGEVIDDNVESVDVLPTIAELLGVDLPWEVDGVSASKAAAVRDPDVKTLIVNAHDLLGGEADGLVVEIDARREFDRLLEGGSVVPGSGPDAVWQRTAHGDLLRQPIDDLTVGEPAGVVLYMREPDAWDPVDTSEPLPLMLVGNGDLPAGTVVAFGVNGEHPLDLRF